MSNFRTKRISNEKNYNNKNLRKEDNFGVKIPQKFKKNEPQKKNIWRKIFKIIFFISIFLASTFSVVFAVYKLKIEGLNIGSGDDFKIFNPVIFSGSIEEKEKEVENILIGGIGGLGHPGGELTDSLMLASLNYKEKTVTLLSIPRDLFVAFSKNTAGKINELYYLGQRDGEGINYLAKKVSEITGQEIHHYVIIDFSGFKKIVDALGGVTVNVPNRIYDREYPNENWGYEVFSLNAGIQELDGKTALKFVRSRHSTSDFDRSSRQQLLLRAMKDKALSLGIITNPNKISEIINSVQNSINTDLTVGDLVDIGKNFKDVDNDNIIMYSLNDDCNGVCSAGSFLYQPPLSLFDGKWVLIPEGASKSRLSKYDDIRRYVINIFKYPHLKNQGFFIKIVTNRSNLQKARLIRKSLEQLGFPIDHATVISQTGATLGNSRIIANYNNEKGLGINEDNLLIKVLKNIEPNIPITFSMKNEYVEEEKPFIEIVLGDDIKTYFNFSTPVEYLVQPINLNEKKPSNEKENDKKNNKEKIKKESNEEENNINKLEDINNILDINEPLFPNKETQSNQNN